jgi:hypothetical protein
VCRLGMTPLQFVTQGTQPSGYARDLGSSPEDMSGYRGCGEKIGHRRQGARPGSHVTAMQGRPTHDTTHA